jgi:hypothetical protein
VGIGRVRSLPDGRGHNGPVPTSKSKDVTMEIFFVAAIGKAIGFILIVLILAVIGFFTIVKKAL